MYYILGGKVMGITISSDGTVMKTGCFTGHKIYSDGIVLNRRRIQWT